ncbi:hypothetical protein B0H19DRAFT_1060157 [Mycena capillaripes]|nr:hypothetical protein B0H19DRAFT_1060157 [Mycena capillaripes]
MTSAMIRRNTRTPTTEMCWNSVEYAEEEAANVFWGYTVTRGVAWLKLTLSTGAVVLDLGTVRLKLELCATDKDEARLSVATVQSLEWDKGKDQWEVWVRGQGEYHAVLRTRISQGEWMSANTRASVNRVVQPSLSVRAAHHEWDDAGITVGRGRRHASTPRRRTTPAARESCALGGRDPRRGARDLNRVLRMTAVRRARCTRPKANERIGGMVRSKVPRYGWQSAARMRTGWAHPARCKVLQAMWIGTRATEQGANYGMAPSSKSVGSGPGISERRTFRDDYSSVVWSLGRADSEPCAPLLRDSRKLLARETAFSLALIVEIAATTARHSEDQDPSAAMISTATQRRRFSSNSCLIKSGILKQYLTTIN